ncbi:DHA2 family efflux MFS transporter permease subunit [Pseudonocardia kujensis]|uniref:DHA2 family efflux MFS transporter permease subunit n=1 Tax=Pseudonocardia kujensis TaxID=1128675 RepID=UPI001E4ACF1C|nr:DHA2 family efflux MFS transporter permease subunit [Pseudonocardia kujensis]MCE0765311.1 DHA2 family efflux MFS transporter permease subunit [Pseudonocardia kujensis]
MSTAARPAVPATGRSWALPLVVLIAGMFMSVLDTSIVNVAVPTIQNSFGATTDEVQWIATAYTLALGVVVPLSAWLSDRYGATIVYIVSLLAFAGGSALCGVAWSLESLVAFRIVQAIPGGILPVVTLAILYRIVPRAQLGAAMGLYGLGIIVAPAVGPTLGGYLVEYVDWRLIFFINVPVGVLGAAAAVAVLPRFGPTRRARFDALGFLTIAVALFSLLLALSEGQDWGWTSLPTVGLACLGVLCLALFVVIELEVDEPLLNVRVFRYWPFTNSLLIISVLSVGLFAVLFYVPVYLQQAQGMGAFEAGFVLLPQALIMAVLMPVAGRLYDRIGPRWPAFVGLVVCAGGTYLLRGLTPVTSHVEIALLLMLRAAGMGMAMMPVMTGGLASVPVSEVNSGSAFNNVVQRTAAALGLAVLTAVVTATQAQMLSDRSALVGPGTPVPALGPGQAGHTLGLYLTYRQTANQSFVEALDNLMVLTTVITLVGAALALLLRSGKVPAAQADPAPAGPGGAAQDAPPPSPGPSGDGATNGDVPAGEPEGPGGARRDPVRTRG